MRPAAEDRWVSIPTFVIPTFSFPLIGGSPGAAWRRNLAGTAPEDEIKTPRKSSPAPSLRRSPAGPFRMVVITAKLGRMRYVLGVSLAMAIVLCIVAFLIA